MSSNDVCLYGDTLEDAIRYRADVTMARMRQVDVMTKQLPADSFLLIRFEELVTDYETQKSRIEDFLHLSQQDHALPKNYFDPAKSIKNIGLHHHSKIHVPDEVIDPLIRWHQSH